MTHLNPAALHATASDPRSPEPVMPDPGTSPEREEPAGAGAAPSGVLEQERTERSFAPHVEETPELTAVDASERRALVIGEALLDVVRRPDGTTEEHPGGSPANVALGLGRLGRGVDLLTWIGADEHGRLVREHLAGSGVAVVPGSDTAPSTSVATATIAPGGGASYEFALSWHVPDQWASPPSVPIVVHTGSIAAVLEPGGADVAKILSAHRESATITYDPNLRPSLMPGQDVTRPLVEGLVGLSDVVKVSDEDLTWLEPDAHPLDVARRWAASGPAVVVVTQGGKGATAVLADGREIDIAAPQVQVADTVGAGDSFMSGLIDGLWSAGLLGAEHRAALSRVAETTLRAILTRCADIAAITVSRAGANPPTTAELEELA